MEPARNRGNLGPHAPRSTVVPSPMLHRRDWHMPHPSSEDVRALLLALVQQKAMCLRPAKAHVRLPGSVATCAVAMAVVRWELHNRSLNQRVALLSRPARLSQASRGSLVVEAHREATHAAELRVGEILPTPLSILPGLRAGLRPPNFPASGP